MLGKTLKGASGLFHAERQQIVRIQDFGESNIVALRLRVRFLGSNSVFII